MRHGIVLLPEHRWRDAEERWRLVERLGYHHAWTYDHLMWRWFAGRRWFGAVPTLAAAATATRSVALGILVATPNFRHPVTLAKDLVTLDDIAGGRLVCGLGAGAPGPDDGILGQPPVPGRPGRTGRFEDFVELLDEVLVRGDVDRTTSSFSAVGLTFHPRAGAGRRTPFAIAATGPRGMALAARFGEYWVTSGPPGDFRARPLAEVVPVVREQIRKLVTACERAGRDPSTLRRLFVADAAAGGVTASVAAYEDAVGVLESLGITDLVVHWPRPDQPFQGDERVLADFAEKNLAGRT